MIKFVTHSPCACVCASNLHVCVCVRLPPSSHCNRLQQTGNTLQHTTPRVRMYVCMCEQGLGIVWEVRNWIIRLHLSCPIYICLSVCLSVWLASPSIDPCVCLSICISVSLSGLQLIFWSVSLFFCLSVSHTHASHTPFTNYHTSLWYMYTHTISSIVGIYLYNNTLVQPSHNKEEYGCSTVDLDESCQAYCCNPYCNIVTIRTHMTSPHNLTQAGHVAFTANRP